MSTKLTALAALTTQLTDRTGKSIQLLPAGRFSARDGRPGNMDGCTCKAWFCGPEQAAAIIARASQQSNPMVIDYEHQTLNADKNGQPAPAAGWFKQMEWRDGQGLFAVDVKWTPAAAKAIADDEYLYISPVFSFNQATGEVQAMHMAAITNNPGLDGMQAVALSALLTPMEDIPMNPVLKALLAALGLNEQTPDDQTLAALTALLAKAKSDADQVAALTAERANKDAQLAAMTARNGAPDPAQYVPLTAVTQMQTQLAALTAQLEGREVDEVVQAALTNGQLLPALETWARDLGKKDIAALKTYIASTPKIAALSGQQTGGQAPQGAGNTPNVDASLLAVCKQMGADATQVATFRTQQEAKA